MTPPNISPTLVKAFDEYAQGNYCGELFRVKYVTKELKRDLPTAANILGHWFEYYGTGQEPDKIEYGLPSLLKSATKKDVDLWGNFKPLSIKKMPDFPTDLTIASKSLMASYKNMYIQARYCRKAFIKHKIKIMQTGVTLLWTTPEGTKTKGILDVLGEDENGHPVIVDIKSTAYIEDRWKEYGWANETIHKRDKLLLQAIFYKWLFIKKFDVNPVFYFFVHDSKTSIKRKIFHIDVTQDTMDAFDGKQSLDSKSRPDFVAEMIRYNNEFGWTPYPSPERCTNCGWRKECKYYDPIASIRVVTI